eukprot:scaffold82023_cov57-Phaeocystis_antarctica.AAC.3
MCGKVHVARVWHGCGTGVARFSEGWYKATTRVCIGLYKGGRCGGRVVGTRVPPATRPHSALSPPPPPRPPPLRAPRRQHAPPPPPSS